MYFDFEDNRPDTPTLPRPISSREGVLLSIIVHLVAVIAILVGPHIPWVRAMQEQRQQALEQERLAALERLRNARFVFVKPRVDLESRKPPPLADLSDKNRQARTIERAPKPTNPLPFSRGNSPELIETRPSPKPEPAVTEPDPNGPADMARALPVPERPAAPQSPADSKPRGPGVGVIADAIRNVQRYAQGESFDNRRGGQNENFGEAIQFDSKGVEFGPWLARFVAQIRSNWFIPQAAWSLHGHVVLTFYVHKDGRITDVTVLKPSSVNSFTLSARNAILTSNPTVPLPWEYPDDKAFFTVTFFFNEQPPGR